MQSIYSIQRISLAIIVVTLAISTSACSMMLGERFIYEPMHNPETGERVSCGGIAHGLDASDAVIHDIAKCVADNTRKGFVLEQQTQ